MEPKEIRANFYTRDRAHNIYLMHSFEPCPPDLFPDETNRAFRDEMLRFPWGQLDYLPGSRTLDEPVLFYDRRRGEYFAASLNDIADAYAIRLNRKWREEQAKRVRTLYWRNRAAALRAQHA